MARQKRPTKTTESPPRSMTGYGAASAAGSRIAVEAEAKSVNAKARKVSLRSPAFLASREPEMEALVRRRVRRGSILITVRVEHLRPQDAIRVRPEIIEGVARALEPLKKRGLIEGKLSADAVAQIPGAIEHAAHEGVRAADWRLVKECVEASLSRLDVMREREAKHLVRDLNRILTRMRKPLATVGRRSAKVVVEQQRKIRERVNALLADEGITLDGATLAREVALLADRADVTEEVTRLAAHLDEFGAYLRSGREIGRTLDFLAQEMLRETNTIGSKSADVEIARAVIALKSEIERLKEQAANLE